MKVMPEDLMDVVIAADNRRRQLRGETTVDHPYWKRLWIEPWFNLLGGLMGRGLTMAPWPLRWRLDQWITQALGSRPSTAPASLEGVRREVVTLARRLHQETGTWPASIFLSSHPDTVGSLAWLRFELFREALVLGNAMVETTHPGELYPPTPKCFLAIDPFALDTVPAPVAGLYAGFMHQVYLVWDRQSVTQSALQRLFFLRGTGYSKIAYRLIDSLRHDVPVIMVLPGGLPHNARLFYAAREFVPRLPVRHWPYPKKEAQKRWMEVVSRPVNNELPIETGILPTATRAELTELLKTWGFSEGEQTTWLDTFQREFQTAVPYRTRLFRVLLQRLVAQGKPLIWAAVAHGETDPHSHVSAPWAAYRSRQGGLQLLRGAQGSPTVISDIAQVAMDFSREFVV